MKVYLLIFSILFGVSGIKGQSIDKDFVPLSTYTTKLFIKKKNSKKKKRLKTNETVKLFFENNTDSVYAKIKLWNEKGLFYTPYQERKDSLLLDSVNGHYYSYEYLIHDTIEYKAFSEINRIDFRKNLKRRTDINILLLTVGIEAFLLPLILNPIAGNGYEDFGPEGFIIVGSGALITTYSWWRIRRLQKLKRYSLDDYEFFIK